MIKVGIFDSGIGGLSILREILLKKLPIEVYYLADSSNAPYGLKPDSFVLDRSVAITQKFVDLGVSVVIVACNTATAIAIDKLRELFSHISFVGVEPYINVINQRTELQDKRGVVLATPLTGNSKRFKDLKERLDPNNILDVYTPKNLAKIIEDHFLSAPEKIYPLIRDEFPADLPKYDYYILGCTHYPLVKSHLEDIFKAQMISPCPMVAKRFVSVFEKLENDFKGPPQEYRIKFLQSGIDADFRVLEITDQFFLD